MQNTSILDALSTRRQFILYRALPPGADGKIVKRPTSPGGFSINAHDPDAWLLPHEALELSQRWNLQRAPDVLSYGVGIVIYAGCGLFALDLDHCRDGAGWLPHVSAFMARFPGAAIEASVSGNGLHIIGSCAGELPKHGVNNVGYRMQMYTEARFIALTGIYASGSPLTDLTRELHAFLGQYFPPHADRDGEWTDTPADTWRGPADDAELIQRALRSRSVGAMFGSGASFADLWHATPEVLERAYPPQTAGQVYDNSAADIALANHLAWWTGGNCERIEAIMRLSALERPKWDREGYLRGTILGACAGRHEWYVQAEPTVQPEPVAAVTVTEPTPAAVAPAEFPAPGAYVTVTAQKHIFAGMCYVTDLHQIQLPNGTTLPKDRFDAVYGGRQYAMTPDGQRPSRSPWDAFVSSELYDFPQVDTQYFKPGDPTGHIRIRERRTEVNSYQAAEIRRVQGDPTPFLDLVKRMLPHGNDAEILLCFMAACTRYLGRKFPWAVFLQGTKGNGKTITAKVLQYCISRRYTHWAKAKELGEKFNSVFVGKLLVIVDEMHTDDRNELQEILKLMVTADQMEVRPMYAEKLMKDVCFNMILIANHQNGVRIDSSERRYCPLFCAQQEAEHLTRDGMTQDYFIELVKWLDADGYAICYDYFMTLEIPEHLNPATRCNRAPTTTSTGVAAGASLGAVEQELIEAISQQADGFRNGWISSAAVDNLLARLGKDRVIPRNTRKSLVLSLGYVPHPSLRDGMCTAPFTDGSMPRIYISRSHAWAISHLSPEQVRDGFIESQRR